MLLELVPLASLSVEVGEAVEAAAAALVGVRLEPRSMDVAGATLTSAEERTNGAVPDTTPLTTGEAAAEAEAAGGMTAAAVMVEVVGPGRDDDDRLNGLDGGRRSSTQNDRRTAHDDCSGSLDRALDDGARGRSDWQDGLSRSTGDLDERLGDGCDRCNSGSRLHLRASRRGRGDFDDRRRLDPHGRCLSDDDSHHGTLHLRGGSERARTETTNLCACAVGRSASRRHREETLVRRAG